MLGYINIINLPQASTVAKSVDLLYDYIFYFSAAAFIAVIGAIVYFLIRYNRRRSNPELTPYIEGHPILETSVMVLLFVVVMAIFYIGWRDYRVMLKTPPHSMEVNITGRQWLWDIEYPNGRHLTNELVVPKGKPVKLIMTSADVLHSFFIPDFRLKRDIVPGTYVTLWFNATQTGEHQVFCAEYCGTSHSGMLAKVRVMEEEEYARWMNTWEWEKQLGISTAVAASPSGSAPGKPGEPVAALSPAERGQKLSSEKGCTACHTSTGAKLVGPSFKGIFGHEVELENGQKVLADENYLRESIVEPNAKMVKGYQPLMPTFKGTLTDDEITSLIAYIKSLAN